MFNMSDVFSKKKIIIIFSFSILILGFYWVLIRPSYIRKFCYDKLTAQADENKNVLLKVANTNFEKCLVSKGMKSEVLFRGVN